MSDTKDAMRLLIDEVFDDLHMELLRWPQEDHIDLCERARKRALRSLEEMDGLDTDAAVLPRMRAN